MKIDFYPAGGDCLLIFTGLGGNTKGGENKYVKIAENAVQKYGFSVFVAGVPEDCWERPQEVFSEAVNHVLTLTKAETVYVSGNSAGASLALWYSHLYPQIKKILAVNPVLNYNYHRTKEGVLKFGGKIFIASGELDPNAKWLNMLPVRDNLSKQIVQGADHSFKDKLPEFISLPDLLFEE
ncbi:MAG: alpha/beta hydrolase [Clostridia bacterium]|nr:alpha/beta hydrolase [Clostridia bacterium]